MDSQKVHQLTLYGREQLTMDGVTNVGSFNREEIFLQTQKGVLVIRGENLHLQQLHLEQGKLSITGKVNALKYSDESAAEKGRGIFKRMFK